MTLDQKRMKIHTVRGGGGLQLHVREWGQPDGRPVVLIHGWSQSHQGWLKQYDSPLADELRLVAFDLRGHGMSEAPLDPACYQDGRLWADDVAAILRQLRIERPVLVGWSYGAFVIDDYLRAHGQDDIAAVNYVAGAVKLGETAFGSLIGPGFLDNFGPATSPDLTTSIQGIRGLVRAFAPQPLPPADVELLLCASMTVPAAIRASLGARQIDDDDVLRALHLPLVVTHGRADTIVLPAMADHILATCPTARASWYDDVGHVPHIQQPRRFNQELADLARQANP